MAAVTIAAASAATGQTADRNDLTAAVRLAVDRGELLYIYDRAAWEGTDELREHHSNLMSQAGGYVVSGDERQTELVFYDKAKSRAIYRATFAAGKLAGSGPPAAGRTELTMIEKQLIEAKDKAMEAFVEAKVALCAKTTPNLAALPPVMPDGPTIVYLMTPQTDLKTYPLGGHFSVEVGQDGSVGKVRRFTNTCIDMALDEAPDGANPVGFGFTHLLDPTPTEIHVFTSLASRMPIFVGTSNDRVWAVEGGSVRTIDQKK